MCGREPNRFRFGVIVVSERGLLDLDVVELHLVEDVAGELAAGAGKIGALHRITAQDAPHPQARQQRQPEGK